MTPTLEAGTPTMVFNNITPFPYPLSPISNISPFTYADGITYLEKLEQMRLYLNEVIAPEFTSVITESVSEFQKGILNAEQTVIASKTEWQEFFDAFMADVLTRLKALDDAAVASLIADLASETAQATRALLPWVNAADYGVSAGLLDNGPAIAEAMGTGGRVVLLPRGIIRVSTAVEMPDSTYLLGAGRKLTTIKLTGLNEDTWVITNLDRSTISRDLTVTDLAVDWDVSRLNQPAFAGTGGSKSSGISFGYTEHINIARVDSLNAGLHGFDITCQSVEYPYLGDGSTAFGPSRFAYCDDLYAENWGDDGFTSHHSEFIWLSNSRFKNPRLRGNNNGIEIDDGSRFVTLSMNYTEGCYSGVEIKAHGTAPAANNVTVNGHTDIGSVRGVSARHIDHHLSTEPDSTSAHDLVFSNLVCIDNNNDKGFQDETSPRAFVVSAYVNWSLNGAVFKGRGGYTDAEIAVAVQYKSNGFSMTNLNISGWNGAGADIYLLGGSNHADNGNVSNVSIVNSANGGLKVGSGVHANISNIQASGPKSGTGVSGMWISDPSIVNVNGVNFTGYANAIESGGTFYGSETLYKQRQTPLPAGLTKFADLKTPGAVWYVSVGAMPAMTDGPPGALGGYIVENSRNVSGATIQTLTRNTSTTFTRYQRILQDVGSPSAWFSSSLVQV